MSHDRPGRLCVAVAVAAALALAATAAAQRATSDPIAAGLDQARQRYAAAVAAADAALLKAFERQITAALNRGDVETSRRLAAVRARFKSAGRLVGSELPAPLKRARQDWAAGRQRAAENFTAALDRAIRGYVRSRQMEQVEALQRERDAVVRQVGATEALVLRLSFEPATVGKDGDRVTIKDVSGNGNDGAQRGMVNAVKDGAVGCAAGFDGRGGDISCGNSESLRMTDAVTVATFVRAAAPTGPVVGTDAWRDGNRAKGFVLRLVDGRPDFTVGDGEPDGWHSATGRAPLPLRRWHHLAATFDGRQLAVYVDGTLAATDAFEGKIGPSSFPLVVGRGTYDRARIFTGDVDEVTVYARALSLEEVREIARGK